MTPLDGFVSSGELDGIRQLYTDEVVQMAEPWAVSGGIANPYTMMWVAAGKGASR